MVLSLTDILTAQQVDRPYKPNDSYKSSPSSKDERPASFGDVLNKPEAKEAVEYAKQFTSQPSEAIKSFISSRGNNAPATETNNNSIPTDAQQVVGNIVDNSKNIADVSTNSLIDNNHIQFIENSSDVDISQASAITLTDLTSALNSAQINGATLTDEQISAANDILGELIEAGIPQGISAGQVIEQVVAQVKSDGFDANSGIDGILQKMNFANLEKTPEKTTQELAALQLAKPGENKEVSKVIEAAKDEAAKPVIAASDLRSLQSASLSNFGKKKDEDGNENQLLDSSVDFTPVTAQEINNVIAKDAGNNSTENLQASLARSNGLIIQQKDSNSLLQDDIAQANSNNAQIATQAGIQQNNSAQTMNPAASNAVSQVIGNAEAGKNEFITTSAKDAFSSSGIMSTENFIKFQNMLDESQETTKSTTNSKFNSPSEVMAQIKFGLGGKGKDESNISIQLHPKELGKVDISMQMAADGKTHITVIAENTDTLNMLQKESGALRDMLTDALQTDSSNLNFTFQQGGSDDWRQQFANNSYTGNRHSDDTENLIGSNYLSSQSYRYNMIATDGLDIRV